MKTSSFTIFPQSVLRMTIMLGLLSLFAACAPQTNVALESAKMDLQAAKANRDIMANSPSLVIEAEDLYAQAERRWRRGSDLDEVNHLVYMTERKLDIAREDTRRKVALDSASVQRLEVREAAGDLSADARAAQVRADSSAMAAEVYRNLARDNRQLVDDLRRDVVALQAQETDRGLELTLSEDVLFDSGASVLKPGSLLRLRPVIAFLKAHPERTVVIEGHTDNVGGNAYNQSLSQRRADAVRALFLTQGISSEQVASRGLGEGFPVTSNNTDAGRQQNRRVQIIISERV